MEGIVISNRYGVYSVLSNGVIYNCSLKGLLKFKNKIYVGDRVILDDVHFQIMDMFERKSYLKRPSISNIDQILLVFSLKEPDFSYYLAFKYLTYASFNNIDASLVLTKADKSSEKEISEIKDVFTKLGIKVYVTSSKTKEGVDEITSMFANKITVLVGQSGVGKSSLLNAIDENYLREVGDYSLALGRGKHKTKETVLLPYKDGFIADTPGFSSLELDMNKLEVAEYFPSFKDDATKCYYSNCLHISEKNCKIKEKVNSGEIPAIAYENYLKLLEEVERY